MLNYLRPTGYHDYVPLYVPPGGVPALVVSSHGLISAVNSFQLVRKWRGRREFLSVCTTLSMPEQQDSESDKLTLTMLLVPVQWICKSYIQIYMTRISEISSTFNVPSMKIGTIWIDFKFKLEKDSDCDNFSIQVTYTIKSFGFKFGIWPSFWMSVIQTEFSLNDGTWN